MGIPVATSDDLATYLGTVVDDPRMTALLGYAQDQLEAIRTPCPDQAKGLVVAIAARAYTNPNSLTGMSLGTGHAEIATTAMGGIGGIFVSKSERAVYRSMTGGTGAFTADMLPAGADEVQALTVSATGGSFVLSFMGVSSDPVSFDAVAADVQAALQAVSTVGAGNVQVSGGSPFVIEFVGDLGCRPLQLISVDGSGLAGSVSVVETQRGVYGAGRNLPPWDKQFGYNPSLGWGWL